MNYKNFVFGNLMGVIDVLANVMMLIYFFGSLLYFWWGYYSYISDIFHLSGIVSISWVLFMPGRDEINKSFPY